MKVVGIIPARFASTRFPGKVLAAICGKPMVQWVYERAQQANLLDELWIATDDERVLRRVAAFGAPVLLTSPAHPTGSDRVAEAAASIEADVVVNIQGDEPLISPEAVDALIAPFLEDQTVQMATLCRKAQTWEEVYDPHTARVVFDKNHDALYFSRAPIPFHRDHQGDTPITDSDYFQHVGVYAYRKAFLLQLAGLPQTPLEKIERLEQLRVLESGYKIRVVETEYSPVCVDIPEDIQKVEDEMLKLGIAND